MNATSNLVGLLDRVMMTRNQDHFWKAWGGLLLVAVGASLVCFFVFVFVFVFVFFCFFFVFSFHNPPLPTASTNLQVCRKQLRSSLV